MPSHLTRSNVWFMNYSHEVPCFCSLHGAPVAKQQTSAYKESSWSVEVIMNWTTLEVNPFHGRAKLMPLQRKSLNWSTSIVAYVCELTTRTQGTER